MNNTENVYCVEEFFECELGSVIYCIPSAEARGISLAFVLKAIKFSI